MKRIISMFLIAYIMLNFTGCCLCNPFPSKPTDSVEGTFDAIVAAIENKDAEEIKSLFSENAKMSATSLDADIDRFLDMFDGKVDAYYSDGAEHSSKSTDHGKISIVYKVPYIMEIGEDKYRISVKLCTIDNYDRNNEGLNSLYIIKESDYQSSYTYWGDGEWTPGIVIDTGERWSGSSF